MTLQELYALMGGNYEQAVKVMRMDRLIDRYVRKLGKSGTFEALFAAEEEMDPTKLHESSHALKGVCANLGLDDIAQDASDVCEQYRPGNERTMTDDEAKAIIEHIKLRYANVMDKIAQYENAS